MIISTNDLISNLKDLLEELNSTQKELATQGKKETTEKMIHFYHDREVGLSLATSKLEAVLIDAGVDVSRPTTVEGELA